MQKELFYSGYYNSDDLQAAGFRSIGRHVYIAKSCTIVGAENISLGDNVRIDGYTSLIAGGDGYIKMGSHIHIGSYCLLSAGAGVVMENFSGFSHGVRVYTQDEDLSGSHLTNPLITDAYRKVNASKVVLCKHSGASSGSTILPGVCLAEGSISYAHSLITKSTKPWKIYFGVPAKAIKNRSKKLLELEQDFLKMLEDNGRLDDPGRFFP